MIFPEHYSETAIAVLSIPGWLPVPGWLALEDDYWLHRNDTYAYVHEDGTISTYPED